MVGCFWPVFFFADHSLIAKIDRMMGVGAKRALGLYRSCAPRHDRAGNRDRIGSWEQRSSGFAGGDLQRRARQFRPRRPRPRTAIRIHRKRRQPRRPSRSRTPRRAERRSRGDFLGASHPRGCSRSAQSAQCLRNERPPHLVARLARRRASLCGGGYRTHRACRCHPQRKGDRKPTCGRAARVVRDIAVHSARERRVRLRARRPGRWRCCVVQSLLWGMIGHRVT